LPRSQNIPELTVIFLGQKRSCSFSGFSWNETSEVISCAEVIKTKVGSPSLQI
jgi:hypothetical protein